ncbi:hypothetical protein B2J93_389 [Marssonina coronariae]|uniref:Uncharacterized protein n=1 Tax=Diplocarpon coronariae TaxID=2795749 RepID=A0A218Z9B9_9HELO|nr:hypothetical protein B2J93_389 [Marssonina coronariae]
MASPESPPPSRDISPSSEQDDNCPIISEPEDGPFSPLMTTTTPTSTPTSTPTTTPTPPSPSASTSSQADKMKHIQVPRHPITAMQAAFAESMVDSSDPSTPTVSRHRAGSAAVRRKLLIDQEVHEETHATRWKQKPGQQYHELWRLMAQISFGVYLLLHGIAKDNEQVMNILQVHVDEVDDFLETTHEDFDLAQEDIEERLKFLKLPLENIIIFDAMLEDRTFRLQIVNGNERIEHVITRTAKAMNDALRDVQQGLDACREFTVYLAREQEDSAWLKDRPDMQQVFAAMKGNVDGWYNAYLSLQSKGNHLGVALVQLGSIVAEMDRRAGEISRKTIARIATTEPSLMVSPPESTESKLIRHSMLKVLPHDPNMITPAIQATLPAFQLVQDRERTPQPESRPSSSEVVDDLEEEFTLKPHVYSPAPSKSPSPRPPTAPADASPSPSPELKKRTSIRQRFSLVKQKENPPESSSRAPPRLAPLDTHWGARQRVHSSTVARERRDSDNTPTDRQGSIAAPSECQSSATTPPSRGLDSAYCSDFEKTSPQTLTDAPTHRKTVSRQSSGSRNTEHSQQTIIQHHFSRDHVPSPRSDLQFFHPVQASPHSPLQRPWTAGPSNRLHLHSNSSISNLSSYREHHSQAPSQLGNRRGAPSAMGMSVMSDMTMVTEMDVNGENKRMKKKRSAFGWLKKAFSLSEDEKAAFEAKKKGDERERAEYYQGQQKRWVDGRRVEGRRPNGK